MPTAVDKASEKRGMRSAEFPRSAFYFPIFAFETMAENKQKPGDETVAINRRGRFSYDIEDSVETGLVLTGTEVNRVLFQCWRGR